MIEYLCNREEIDRIEEREQTLLSLLTSFSIQILDRFDLDRMLNLALKAKFFKACEILYEFKGEYYEIIDCYLNKENSEERQAQIFNIVRHLLDILYETRSDSTQKRSSTITIEPRDVQLKKLQDKLLAPSNLHQLISISPTETVHLLWIEMNIDLKYLVRNIKQNSNDLLYNFIKGLFQQVEVIKSDRRFINQVSQFGPEYCELYVELICINDPNSLLNLLKTTLSDYSFRIDECLRICREKQHWDGAAYLLEKSGQIEASFTLHLEKLTSLIKDLQKQLENLSDKELDVLKSSIDSLLVLIVEMCQRNVVKENIWFSLFDEVMRPIRSLFIHPSVEIFTEETDEFVKARLEDTKEFFKGLGSYIINSMVGYLNLTIIIDRMICDPLYGASNFGDIKDLMMKMLEMCSYEQTLLLKTSNLVSKDVYEKMLMFKRLSSRSFSSFTNFCQYCARGLDVVANENQVIFQCGHSFHQSCLEMIQTQASCPVCCPVSTHKIRKQRAVGQVSQGIVGVEKEGDEYNLSLTSKQVEALKAIRSRNSSLVYSGGGNTMLERQSKLDLVPGNLIKFV